MSESGVSSRRTESDVDIDNDEVRGNRTLSACSPATPSTGMRKGKGGRKVLFPSAEEKKQRNRDSQAAFRSRRKEHITELENIVQEQKEEIQESKNAHAGAKEEVLILKYKNSLLERILLEQGIDVNAELNNILVFPLRLPEKRVRKERALARQNPEVAPAKKAVAVTSPANSTSACCHCSSSRKHSSPISQSSSPEIPVEETCATTTQLTTRKRARQSSDITTDTTAHKRPRSFRKHRDHTQTRSPNTRDLGKLIPSSSTRYIRRASHSLKYHAKHLMGTHAYTLAGRVSRTLPTNLSKARQTENMRTDSRTAASTLTSTSLTSAPTIPISIDDSSSSFQSVAPRSVSLAQHENRAAKSQEHESMRAALDFDFDFEAGFSFGAGLADPVRGGFDMDLGFLGSVSV
ncbi:uncharacterized protein RCO7_08232 [Rhynchosporium graminicola]|uniref:BZIP domain-containing protein n=1 Tax=Rhynchosporium graminicola TaxID=2792576 RepID=A0A1E1LDB9_9HELO|nr:uncharacterized protein RCO7_08232 [Rhynchosporium commune]